MRRANTSRSGERGAALLEFTIGALVFLTATFGVLEFSRLLWTHNALSDATRRAARFAVNQKNPADANPEAQALAPEAVKRVAIYGNPEGTGEPLVNSLKEEQVIVEYTNSTITGLFGYPDGEVTVSITGYKFNFVVPFVGTTITMPDYRTTLTAESAGMIPGNITTGPTPSGSPAPEPTPGETPTPEPTPGETPEPTPSATPLPTPTPPRSCRRGDFPALADCVCRPPLRINGSGKCN